MNRTEMIAHIDSVINNGPYKDNWESICIYTPPQWYTVAKFGIFMHWGVYSVPPERDHCEDWLLRVCELADKYWPIWYILIGEFTMFAGNRRLME